MEVKEEYVAFALRNYCNGTGAVVNVFKDKNGKYYSCDGYYHLSYEHRTSTIEEAKNILMSAFKNVDEIHYVADEQEARSLSVKYKGQTLYFIMQVPKSFYLGDTWEKTLNAIGDTRWSDEKPSQVYKGAFDNKSLRSYNVYLKRVEGKEDEWVEDKFNASFFTPQEAKHISDQFCQKWHKGDKNGCFAYTTEHLLRPNEGESPKFEKGDEVFVLLNERHNYSLRYIGYKVNVLDIKVIRNAKGEKEFGYSVDIPNADFLPLSYFKTRKEIIADGGKFYNGKHNGCWVELLDYNGKTYYNY